MRKQFVKTLEDVLAQDERVVLFLGDIGIHGFRDAFSKYPGRVYNIGILEQATVSMAAGFAAEGMIPVFHTVAPFIAARAFEQLKVDFGYQGLGGNFVSVGASYEYASLGCTHHCPEDVQVLSSIPGMQIVVPSSNEDFDLLFKQAYNNGSPTYFRLTERPNGYAYNAVLGKAQVIQSGGRRGTVVVVGPLLDMAKVSRFFDVSLIHYATAQPFDRETLRNTHQGSKVVLIEPFYEGTLAGEVSAAIDRPVEIRTIGVPREFLKTYGKSSDHDRRYGLTSEAIYDKLRNYFP